MPVGSSVRLWPLVYLQHVEQTVTLDGNGVILLAQFLKFHIAQAIFRQVKAYNRHSSM